MWKNIVLGALAGAAVAYLIVEKKNHKSMQNAYNHLSEYFMTMGKKVMTGLEKGKDQAGVLSKRAGKMIHAHLHN